MKSFKQYLLIVALSALPFVAVFATPLMIHTHDGPMHIARIPAYYKALTGGQILPRWAGELNYGYGMPLFNFYYHLPYLFGSLLVSVGLNLAWSFKIMLLFSFLLSGCFMYLFAYAFFKDRNKALVMTVLYQFAPFHLVDMVVRGDIGEVLAMTFLPLVLYFLVRVFEEDHVRRYCIATGVATALMILSHSAIGLIYFATCVFFVIFFAPNTKKRIAAGVGLGIGVLLTAFFWIPVLLERKYTYGDFFMKDMYKTHFAPVWNFFIPNLTNSTALQNGGVDVSFGLIQTAALLMSVWLLVKNKLQKNVRLLVWFGLIITAVALFVMISPSAFLWEHIPVLRAFQFPWRFLTITVFSLSVLGAAVLVKKNTPKFLVIGIVVATIASSLVYFRPPLGFDKINENYFWHYPLDTTFFGETNLIWSAGPAGSYPKAPIELIAGKGEILNPVRNETKHTFTVIAETNVQILDNTQYYPGWRVYSGTTKIPVEFQDQNHRGIITFHLPPGTHHVTVSFGETPVRTVADVITVSTITAIAFSFFLPRKKKR
jgi:uncharacterized membrane protein